MKKYQKLLTYRTKRNFGTEEKNHQFNMESIMQREIYNESIKKNSFWKEEKTIPMVSKYSFLIIDES